MALVRPAKTETSDGKFTGILPVCIWDFKDRSSEYDWADVFISVELDIQGSEYNRSLEICGGLERDSKGQVSGGHVLKPLYHLFDTLGFGGGLNAKGEWEDEDEECNDHRDIPVGYHCICGWARLEDGFEYLTTRQQFGQYLEEQDGS